KARRALGHTPRRRWRSEYASDIRLPCQADQFAYHGCGKASGRQDEFKLQNVRPRIMPRQATNGEAKNTPFMLHTGFCEPLGDCRLGCRHIALKDLRRLARWRWARSPQGAGGMQVQNRQAGVGAFVFASDKEA